MLVHVRLTNYSGTLKERQQVGTLERQINQALRQNRFDELDGDEFDGGECMIYIYAYDADALYSCVQPALESSPVRRKVYAVKRYGPPGSREARVNLSESVQAEPPVRRPHCRRRLEIDARPPSPRRITTLVDRLEQAERETPR